MGGFKKENLPRRANKIKNPTRVIQRCNWLYRKYGLPTLRTPETMDRELQQFASRRLRGIIYQNSNKLHAQENNRPRQDNKETIRRRRRAATFYSHLGKDKSVTYTDGELHFTHHN